jgi:hypothetical protein
VAIVHRADRGQDRRRSIRLLLGLMLRELFKGLALIGTTCFCPISAHAAREGSPRDPERDRARDEVAYLEALWRL